MAGNVFKRDDKWYARVTVQGKQLWRTAATKTAAQALLPALREEADRMKGATPRRAKTTTLAEWAPIYLEWAEANKKSADHDASKMVAWVAFMGGARLKHINRDRVHEFVAAKQKEGRLTPATINRYVACLRKAMSLAVERGELEVNPLLGFRHLKESPARQPVLSREDETLLLKGATPWMAWFIRLALSTGARQMEIANLTWGDVDFANRVIIIRDSKSGESRRIPLPTALATEMQSRMQAAPAKSRAAASVAPGADGKVSPQNTIASAWKRARAAAHRPDLRFHDLRHVAASRLLAQGASLPEVAAWLGHKTLVMSRRYAHVSWDRLSAMVNGVSGSECERA